MTAVFGFVENLACLGKHTCGQRDGAVDRALFCEEIHFLPLLPGLERFTLDLGREAHAVSLLDVKADDEHLGPTREVGAVFPKRAIRRVVVLPYFYRFDDSVSPNRKSRAIAHYSAVRRRIPIPMDEHRGAGWRIISSSYPITTPFLRLRNDVIELPDGGIVEDYYVRETRGFTIIFALTADGRVVLVRQYKHGAGRVVLELPAGSIDEGETAAQCAERELAEETGFVGGAPERIGTYLADPTSSDGSFHLFLIRDAQSRVAQSFDRTEDIAVEIVPVGDLRRMLREGRIETGSHVASIYATLEYLQLLEGSC
jgi:ADP-ribose pyrophosphatase